MAEQDLDIFCHDSVVRKHLVLKNDVKMNDMERAFHEDQRTRRKMYCEDFVDRKWIKTTECRSRDLRCLDKMREDAEKERELFLGVPVIKVMILFPPQLRPRGRSGACCLWLHLLNQVMSWSLNISIRKVRPEFYETVDKLRSYYHISQPQVAATVITVGDKMFGRTWKQHDRPESIDLDTLP